jgi:hypothetical protein
VRGLMRDIWRTRVGRWAVVALALNAWTLLIAVLHGLGAKHTVTLFPEAADVRPYLNPDTREVTMYKVENVSVEDVMRQSRWRDTGEVCGLAVLNIVLFAWLLRVALTEQRQAPAA